MGLFEKNTYKKDKYGRWKLVDSKVEKAPHDMGRWKRSLQMEENSSLGEKTYITPEITKGGLNIKVKQARTYFGPNDKVVRTLITTSNKLPKSYKRGEK